MSLLASAPSDARSTGDAAAPEPFGITRLLLVGTGSLTVAHLPFWVNWIRSAHPGVELRVVLTRAAARFVSPHAIAPLLRRPVETDEWSAEPVTCAPHVELNEWADAVVVHPATLHFVARMALGLADSPVMLALQCARVPVAVAPAFPPGAADNPLVGEHLRRLGERPNVVVVPGGPGISAATGRSDGMAPAALPTVIGAVEHRRRQLAAAS